MSESTLEKIIARAVNEPDFRALLLKDPAKALVGYQLTEEDMAKIKAMTPESFDALAGDLKTRISKILGGP